MCVIPAASRSVCGVRHLGHALARSHLKLSFFNSPNVTEIISDADYHLTTNKRERVNSMPWPEVSSCARAGLDWSPELCRPSRVLLHSSKISIPWSPETLTVTLHGKYD